MRKLWAVRKDSEVETGLAIVDAEQIDLVCASGASGVEAGTPAAGASNGTRAREKEDIL